MNRLSDNMKSEIRIIYRPKNDCNIMLHIKLITRILGTYMTSTQQTLDVQSIRNASLMLDQRRKPLLFQLVF